MINTVATFDANTDSDSMDNLLTFQTSSKHHCLVEGKVVSVNKDGVWVDIGRKSESFVANDDTYSANLKIGDNISLLVLANEDGDEPARVSAKLAQSWKTVLNLKEHNDINNARFICLVKSKSKRGRIDGAIACLHGLDGFIPTSHLGHLLPNLVGTEVPVKVLEADPSRSRLILSCRLALRELEDQFFATVQPGQRVTGSVISIVDFGAFVELTNGITGLLHKSEIFTDKVEPPHKLLTIGDTLQLLVTKVDRQKRQVCFSLKQAKQKSFLDTLCEGQTLVGEVSRLTDYGAFVTLGDCLDGLLPITKTPANPYSSDQFQETMRIGQTINVIVTKLNIEHKQVILRLQNSSLTHT